MDEASNKRTSSVQANKSVINAFKPVLCDIVSNRAALCRNSVLASQIQKAVPFAAASIEQRDSLHSVLQKISVKSFTTLNKDHKKQEVVFQVPKKSIHPLEAAVDEYVIVGKENKLLTTAFVRNLPVTIQEKRHYRKSVVYALKKMPWYSEYKEKFSDKLKKFLSHIDLWYDDLKRIEGRHGAAAVSYFFFVRWLLYMNFIIFLLNFFFLVLPQFLLTKDEKFSINYSTPISPRNFDLDNEEKEFYQTRNFVSEFLIDNNNGIINFSSVDDLNKHCQVLYSQQITNNTRTGFFATIQSILQGTGPLESSLLFLGFYPPYNINRIGSIYNVPLASLCLIFLTFLISMTMMIQYSSIGIQEAFLAHNKRSNYYSNEVFSAWNYCLDSPKSAEQEHYSFVLVMKTNLTEDQAAHEVTQRSSRKWAKLYTIRFVINIIIITWLFSCYFLIYSVTLYQMRELQSFQLSDTGFRTFMVQFLSPLTVMILNSVSPAFFSFLIQFENYHAQTVLNVSLIRNVFLYLSSVMVLLNTFYWQTACEPKDHCGAGLGGSCNSPRCWETYIGQQLFKLTLTDLFVYVGVFLGVDTFRNYITRTFDNKFTRLWGPPVFPLPTEVLAPVNSQTILWLGVFYSPLLPGVMVLKLIIIFYIKKTKILKYCEPSQHSYRASRFNAVFMMILLISFFTVLIGQTFAIERISPSRGCGPYRQLDFMTKAIPDKIRNVLSLFMSQWTILITTVLLCIAMDYYWGVIVSEKELTKQLKSQLVLQSCDKQYLLKQIADLTNDK